MDTATDADVATEPSSPKSVNDDTEAAGMGEDQQANAAASGQGRDGWRRLLVECFVAGYGRFGASIHRALWRPPLVGATINHVVEMDVGETIH